jgi:alpha-N-acetylglucosaminidase
LISLQRILIAPICGMLAACAASVPHEPIETAASRAVIERTIGARARELRLELVADEPGREWYEVDSGSGAVTIKGSSAVALTRGAYSYLNAIGAASVSWEGNRVALPAKFPDFDGPRTHTPFTHRAYLNVCTYGYTTAWWDWSRWEREIDWMALHGIDMPLAMEGQEFVWQALWREFGLTTEELAEHFSGPAFTPWQRMGNIEGHLQPLPQSWIESKRALQIRILERMRTLGMKPVLPAFGGYVPKAFADRHPQARIYKMRPWEGFRPTYWLDPADPLFATLAKRFIEIYDATYGRGGYYLSDSFNEMLPPISDNPNASHGATYGDAQQTTHDEAAVVSTAQRDAKLAAYGAAIYDSIRQANPQAVWVMQGWLFGADRHFWTPEAIRAFLSKVPDDKLLVLDIGNDRYPGTWEQSGAFYGKSWIYGYVHNYGGSNPVYGDFDFYRRDLTAVLAHTGKGNLAGFGVFPEGLHNNSVVYEYLYDRAWNPADRPVQEWLHDYTRARYGKTSPELLDAWAELQQAMFSTRYWSLRWWNKAAGAYLLFKRPTAKITQAEPVNDRTKLKTAVTKLLAVADDYASSDLFRYDLVDFTRHYASQEIDLLLQTIVRAYERGDIEAADAGVTKLIDVVSRLDLLLGGQQETLATWIDAAAASGTNAAEMQYHERNARAQVTIWGGEGNLNDYASKAWQGLYKDFYLPRWTMFLGTLKQATLAKAPLDEKAVRADIAAWERKWVESDVTYERSVAPDTVAAIRALLARLEQP